MSNEPTMTMTDYITKARKSLEPYANSEHGMNSAYEIKVAIGWLEKIERAVDLDEVMECIEIARFHINKANYYANVRIGANLEQIERAINKGEYVLAQNKNNENKIYTTRIEICTKAISYLCCATHN